MVPGTGVSFRHLSLAGNRLTGTLPEELFGIGALEWLELSYNRLTGTVPSNASGAVRCDSLGNLSLAHNAISGTLPAWLAELENLTTLNLKVNHLSCKPPKHWRKVESLDILTGNVFSCPISDDLTSLDVLCVSEAHLPQEKMV